MHIALNWFARIAGLAFSMLLFLSIRGNSISDQLKSFNVRPSHFVILCLPVFFGYLWAWKNPYKGGLTMVFGSAILASFFLYFNAVSLSLIHSVPALLVGLAFIAAASKQLL
jgi:hypothetical protein